MTILESEYFLEELDFKELDEMPIDKRLVLHFGNIIPDIISRGRVLLKDRSISEIITAKSVTDWMAYTYAKNELKVDPRTHYALEHRNELNALRGFLNTYTLEDIPSFPKGKDYEYFTCLSYLMLKDSIDSQIESLELIPALKIKHELSNPPSSSDPFEQMGHELLGSMGYKIFEFQSHMQFSGTSAIKAVEAMCFAEHLYEISNFKDKITSEFKEEQKRKKTLKFKELNMKRHAPNREAKDKVLREWEENRDQFLSAEKAGGHYASWLTEKGYKDYTPRTITTWIREHAKEIGVKFRQKNS